MIFGASEMSGNVDLGDETKTMVVDSCCELWFLPSLMKLLQTFKFG
jgi:hypothetical protein